MARIAIRRDTGHPPPLIGTLLAATALEHDLYLATRNVRAIGAVLFDPWNDPAPVLARRRRPAV